jgi:hypothetical protein
MNYPFLKLGNHLPSVGILQKLLKAQDIRITVDGQFGLETYNAVLNVQRLNGLVDDGQVGIQTWSRIVSDFSLPIVDFVDIFDFATMRWDLNVLAGAGSTPLTMGGVCHGVEQMVNNILSSAPRNVFLLRFTDHGDPGIAGMGDGTGSITTVAQDGTTTETNTASELSYIGNDNLSVLRPFLEKLRPIFGPYGCVQFMGCSTGSGTEGRRFLEAMADIFGVPVSAGVDIQYGGVALYPLGFQGPTNTVVPHGGSLRSWCRSRPEFAGGVSMSVYN